MGILLTRKNKLYLQMRAIEDQTNSNYLEDQPKASNKIILTITMTVNSSQPRPTKGKSTLIYGQICRNIKDDVDRINIDNN